MINIGWNSWLLLNPLVLDIYPFFCLPLVQSPEYSSDNPKKFEDLKLEINWVNPRSVRRSKISAAAYVKFISGSKYSTYVKFIVDVDGAHFYHFFRLQ